MAVGEHSRGLSLRGRILPQLVMLALLVACGGNDPGAAVEGSYKSVDEVAAALEEAGLPCTGVESLNPGEEQEGASSPSPSPEGAGVMFGPTDLEVVESGVCVLDGTPRVLGKPLGSVVTIYEDDEHLDYLPDQGFPNAPIIYGDNWEIVLAAPQRADEVASALDGEVIPEPTATQEEIERQLSSVGAQCFLMASLPPGFEEVARSAGLEEPDPEQFARGMAQVSGMIPPQMREIAYRDCLFGLRLGLGEVQSAQELSGQRFHSFWMGVCVNAHGDPAVSDELGFGRSIPYDEFGERFTHRFLTDAPIFPSALDALAKDCGNAPRKDVLDQIGRGKGPGLPDGIKLGPLPKKTPDR